MYWSRIRDPRAGKAPIMAYDHAPGAGAVTLKVVRDEQPLGQLWHPDTSYVRLDASGNARASGNRRYHTTATAQGVTRERVAQSATQCYYGADDKLRFLQKYD